MVFLALAVWVVATVLLAVPAAVALRRLDVEEPVDDVQLTEAMRRHPSRRPRAA
jgi:hypothetical protein